MKILIKRVYYIVFKKICRFLLIFADFYLATLNKSLKTLKKLKKKFTYNKKYPEIFRKITIFQLVKKRGHQSSRISKTGKN